MKKLMILLVLMSFAVPFTAFAQPGPGHKAPWADKMHKGKKVDRIGQLLRSADEIGLSEEQVAKLKEMRMEFKMATIEHRAEIEKAKVQLKFLMSEPDSPERDVFEAIERVAGLKAEMQKMRFSARREVRSLLTESQREKIKEHKKKMRQERKEMREMFPPDGRHGMRRGARRG